MSTGQLFNTEQSVIFFKCYYAEGGSLFSVFITKTHRAKIDCLSSAQLLFMSVKLCLSHEAYLQTLIALWPLVLASLLH